MREYTGCIRADVDSNRQTSHDPVFLTVVKQFAESVYKLSALWYGGPNKGIDTELYKAFVGNKIGIMDLVVTHRKAQIVVIFTITGNNTNNPMDPLDEAEVWKYLVNQYKFYKMVPDEDLRSVTSI